MELVRSAIHNMETLQVDNLIELNDDVLLETIKHLNVFDIIALRQVCQRFELLTDDHLSRKVKEFRIDVQLDQKFKEIIRNLGHHLDKLHLISVQNTKRLDKLRHQIQSINKYCNKLKSLTIETRKWYDSVALNSSVMSKLHFPHLKYLELHNIKMEKDFELMPSFEHLESLKLDSIANFSGHSLIGLRHLNVLHLTSCAQLKPNYLYDFFKANGDALKEIMIHKCRDIDEIILNEINSHLPNIELISLIFSFPASFDPSTLHCLQSLRSLSLHNFRTYDVNRFIKRIATNNSLEKWEINGENMKMYQLDFDAIDKLEKSEHLNELSFVRCNFVSDELLLKLAKSLNLKKFSVCDCWGFTVNGLMKFVHYSKKLTYLSIKNCTILRSATIDIANMVLEDEDRPAIHIDYDIDCGYRPYADDDFDDFDMDFNGYDKYWDSDSSDTECI